MSWLFGIALNLLAGFGAWKAGAVTAGGAGAGLAVGTAIYVGAGPLFWLCLMLFVAGSSALDRVLPSRDASGERSAFAPPAPPSASAPVPRSSPVSQAKGSRRDAVQVLANGSWAAIAAVAYGLTGASTALVALGSALAAANADTWAGEVGIRSRRAPVSIVSLRPVAPGLSGGVTTLGLGGGAVGAGVLAVAATAAFFHSHAALGQAFSVFQVFLLIAVAGFTGNLVDSLLGATVQAKYRDERDGISEHSRDANGRPRILLGGFRWITNDAVNWLSSGAAALLGTTPLSLA